MGKEEDAIYLIRMAADMSKRYYDKPFVCTYSGGKDSDVVLELCKRAGVPFVVQHSITTVKEKNYEKLEITIDYCRSSSGSSFVVCVWSAVSTEPGDQP